MEQIPLEELDLDALQQAWQSVAERRGGLKSREMPSDSRREYLLARKAARIAFRETSGVPLRYQLERMSSAQFRLSIRAHSNDTLSEIKVDVQRITTK